MARHIVVTANQPRITNREGTAVIALDFLGDLPELRERPWEVVHSQGTILGDRADLVITVRVND